MLLIICIVYTYLYPSKGYFCAAFLVDSAFCVMQTLKNLSFSKLQLLTEWYIYTPIVTQKYIPVADWRGVRAASNVFLHAYLHWGKEDTSPNCEQEAWS